MGKYTVNIDYLTPKRRLHDTHMHVEASNSTEAKRLALANLRKWKKSNKKYKKYIIKYNSCKVSKGGF